MLIYKELYDEEKNITIPLWKRCFSDDSRQFISVYYRNCLKHNKIYAILDDIDNSPAAMLHLNPYTLTVNGHMLNSFYIVAAATAPEYRRKGLMRKLLCSALENAAEMRTPFVYLTAENENVYTPFGFVRIGFQYEINTSKNKLEDFISYLCSEYSYICTEANSFTEIPQSYDIIKSDIIQSDSVNILKTVRDKSFYDRYISETEADGGHILFFNSKSNRCGKKHSPFCSMTYYEAGNKTVVTDFYNIPDTEKFFTPAAVRPLMLRITDVSAFVALLGCRQYSGYVLRTEDL